jgi:hypothetical protein
MKRTQLIWGIVCLALAGLLAVLYLTLPPGKVTFMVDGKDMPYVPSLVLAVLGVILLLTARKVTKKDTREEAPVTADEQKIALNKRLETIGWGCFLIMLGGFVFVPHMIVSGGYWSIGVGVIMLGLNIARYRYQIRMSGFTTVLGIISLLSGIAQLLGMNTLGGASLFIILGAYLVLKPWFERRKLFGKAEESK